MPEHPTNEALQASRDAIAAAVASGQMSIQDARAALKALGFVDSAIDSIVTDANTKNIARQAAEAAAVAEGDPLIPPTPPVTPTPEATGLRPGDAASFLGRERDPRDVFQRFLSTGGLPQGLSGFAQQAIENQFDPSFTSFLAQPGVGRESQFRDFLKSGASFLDPRQQLQFLDRVGGNIGRDVDELGASQLLRREFFGDAQFGRGRSEQAAIGSLLPGTNPLFRSGLQRGLRDTLFNFEERNPQQNFLGQLESLFSRFI